tara:strand:- start:2032 stop:2487 length:456 start_codon:yes stop_codon:yes gene_type:complete
MLRCKITGITKVKMTDRKTFSTHERRIIANYATFIEKIWCETGQKLVRSYGQSDEGESWFVLSKDTPDGVSNLLALSIEIEASNLEAANGELKNYRHWCYSRYLEFQADDLMSLIEASHSDAFFNQFMEYHQSASNIDEGRDNVIQLISAS